MSSSFREALLGLLCDAVHKDVPLYLPRLDSRLSRENGNSHGKFVITMLYALNSRPPSVIKPVYFLYDDLYLLHPYR